MDYQKYIGYINQFGGDFEGVLRNAAIYYSIDNEDSIFYSYHTDGTLELDVSAEFVIHKIEKLGFRKVFESLAREESQIFIRNNGEFCYLSILNRSSVELSMVSKTQEEINDFDAFFKKHKKPFKEKGEVFVLVQGRGGIDVVSIGDDYHELERDNYDKEVLDAYDHTISSFTEDKNGHISIFSGPPGVGKTFILRSILGNIEGAKFLYVPASMVSQLAGPGLIGVLHDLSEEVYQEEKIKIVMILEDADEVLAPRNQTDISGVSVLLNLTDGILGRLMNIKIVATTNSEAKSLDKAILRPGRICVHCPVPPLTYEKALVKYEKLTEGREEIPPLPKDHYTLAEIYHFAANPKELQKKKANKIGF